MPLLTRADLRRQSPLAWVSLLALLAMAAWFWELDKRNAALGTVLAVVGCLGLILPPRERMAALPWRLRALPRRVDAAPGLASLISSPGYGLNWFYGENPYDEIVHLVSGGLAGAVFLALVMADGQPRGRGRLVLIAALFGLNLGCLWEAFEYSTRLIGDWTDTWTDIALTTFGAALAGLRRPEA